MLSLNQIKEQTASAITNLLKLHPQQSGNIFVIGCSSSEIIGGSIGHNSNQDVGYAVFETAYKILNDHNLYLAAQCCEHLNRAIVIEDSCAEKYGFEKVSVVPWLKGGGSFATATFYGLQNAAVVEHIKASAGLDIGNTLIGMHLKDVAVPVRLPIKQIGQAHLTAAYCRPKLIGGERARYHIEKC